MRTLHICAILIGTTGCASGQLDIFNEPHSLAFSEAGDCATAHGEPIDLGSSFTFEAWVHGTNDPIYDYGPIITFGNIIMLWTDSSSTTLSEPTRTPTTGIQTGTSLYDGLVHHIAVSWDDEIGGAIYIDGQQHGLGTTLDTLRIASTIRIGCLPGANTTFEGSIDEVRISSGNKYETLFEVPSASPTDEEDTIALWHLDSGVGEHILESDDRLLGSLSGTTWTDPLITEALNVSASDTGLISQ